MSEHSAAGYPNRFERVLKAARDVLLILWLLVPILVMILVMAGMVSYGSWLGGADPAPAPGPVPTDCIEGWDC